MKAPAAAALVAIATFAWPGPAGAVEREQHLGVDLGGALLVLRDKSTPDAGGSVGLHWSYGLSDAFNLMAEGAWSLVALDTPHAKSTPPTLPTWNANADVGVAYVLDVLQWVPYAGVLVGGYTFGGGTIDGVKVLPGAALALGLDYHVRPNVSVGFAVRQHWVTDVYPSFTQAFLRAEYVWGW